MMPARSGPTVPLDAAALGEIERIYGRARERGLPTVVRGMPTDEASIIIHSLPSLLAAARERDELRAQLDEAREKADRLSEYWDDAEAEAASVRTQRDAFRAASNLAHSERDALRAQLDEATRDRDLARAAGEKHASNAEDACQKLTVTLVERDALRVSETGERARAAYLEGALIRIGEYAEKHSHLIAMASVVRAVKEVRESLASDPFGPKGTDGT